LNAGHLLLSLGRVDDAYFANLCKFIDDIRNGTIDAFAVQLPAEQAAEQQGEHTTEHMYLHLLIGPMVLGTQGNVVAVLHTSKGGFHMVLASVATYDLHLSPLIVVRKEDCLSKQSVLQPLPGTVVESIVQHGQTLGVGNVHLKQLLHMPGFEPALDFLGHTFQRGPTALANLAFSVPAELMFRTLDLV